MGTFYNHGFLLKIKIGLSLRGKHFSAENTVYAMSPRYKNKAPNYLP